MMGRPNHFAGSSALALTLALSVAAVVSAPLSAACGSTVNTGARLTVEQLRDRAADRPRDADAQRELAVGEMLMQGGDYDRVSGQLQLARELAPQDERVLYLSGVFFELAGHPGSALNYYLDALDAATRSTLGVGPYVAEAAAEGVEDLEGVAPRWMELTQERLSQVAANPGAIGPPARYVVGRVLIEGAQRGGDAEEVARLAADHGCLTEMRSAGPFGPWALLGFDERFAPERVDGPLAEAYELGPTRGRRPTRDLGARGCAVHLGGGPIAAGGTTYAEAFFRVPVAGDYVLRVETPNSVEILIDGESALRLDHRVDPLVRTTFHRRHFAAGNHRVLAKVTTRHPNPVLAISVTDGRGRAPSSEGPAAIDHVNAALDFAIGRPVGGSALAAYLRAVVSMSRGDVVGAREALRHELPRRGASPAMLQKASVIALLDPLLPSDVGRDRARRYLRRAKGRDDGAWFPVVQLAKLDAAEGHVLSALTALEGAGERWPEVVAIPLSRAELLLSRGWDAQAASEVAAAREIVPGSCAPLRAAMSAAERRLRQDEITSLADLLVRCDARHTARYTVAVRARAWDEANAELDRIALLEPPQSLFTTLARRLAVARGRNDTDAIEELLGEMSSISPRSILTPIAQADRQLAAGDIDAARAVLTGAIEREPSALADLRMLSRAIGGDFALTPYRLDGATVIREFEGSDRSYDEPEVLVLDYTVVRVFEDGSSLELTHNIWKVQADEALDSRGEFIPPPGSQVLTLHTIKADGRRIEADVIEGKESISLPQLEPGDYVEYEYVGIGEPARAFPGGYLGNRFYFRGFEKAYDLSQLTVVLPVSMEPNIDPRGPAPETETSVDGDLRVLRWTVHESRPLPAEPGAIAATEYLPSINVGSGATWELFIESLRDALVDQDVSDPGARRLVVRVLGGSRRSRARVRAARLYRWVVDNVEDTNEVFGLAPAMLVQRTGNRARILHYLYGLAGVRSKLVLARTLGADATETDLPDPQTYQHLLLMVGDGERATFVSTSERGAPFGYVPPMLRDQPALVLGEGGGQVHVPAGAAGADQRSIEVDLTIAADGSATATVVETFRGAPAIAWRGDLEGIPRAMLEQRFEEGYVARLVAGARLTGLRVIGREALERPLVFEYSFEVSELGQRQGGRQRIPMLFPTLLGASFAQVGERTTTQLVGVGTDVQMQMRVHRTGGGALPAAPSAVTLSGPGGSTFTATATEADGALVLDREVHVPLMRIAPTDYPAFASFCRSADEAEARELVLAD